MVVDNINKKSCSVYLLEFNDLWHKHVGHVNYKALWILVTLEVLLDFKCDKLKFEICLEKRFLNI